MELREFTSFFSEKKSDLARFGGVTERVVRAARAWGVHAAFLTWRSAGNEEKPPLFKIVSKKPSCV